MLSQLNRSILKKLRIGAPKRNLQLTVRSEKKLTQYSINNSFIYKFRMETDREENMNSLGPMDLSHMVLMGPPPPPPLIVSCGELREKDNGKRVQMSGRLRRKGMGRFAELKDKEGVTQVVILPEKYPKLVNQFAHMSANAYVTVVGDVSLRPQKARNNSMPTGDIELIVREFIDYERPRSQSFAQKRSFSTMSEAANSRGITSVEHKMIAGRESVAKYFENREITCNDLKVIDVGREVQLVGWLPSISSTKFQQLRDGYGQTQIIIENFELRDLVKSATPETILLAKGRVLPRPHSNINSTYDTGEIEVFIDEVKFLNKDSTPDQIDNAEQVDSVDSTVKSSNADSTNKFTLRTHNCGELNSSHIGMDVTVCGWLDFQRMKKFLILRDGHGKVQILVSEDLANQFRIDEIAFESILLVRGKVIPRPSNMCNPNMSTGAIEINATSMEVLNTAKKTIPFEVREFNRPREALRLGYRYIDLRFPDMQRNLRLRSSIIMKMREYLVNCASFTEVETPTLCRQTPGGAQEFIVPTRRAGHFYSLVQSPQQFKQMLMAGAIDRYFQVARCYRDEATRPDRQPEFTQLDIELSFTDREKVMQLVEELLMYVWPKHLEPIKIPFPRMTYEQAMDEYGTDKPDTRFDLKALNITNAVLKSDSIEKDEDFGAYMIICKEPHNVLPGSIRNTLEGLASTAGCKLIISKVKDSTDNWFNSVLIKIFGETTTAYIAKSANINQQDLIFIAHGKRLKTQTLIGAIRETFYSFLEQQNIIWNRSPTNFKFLWVIDFPMFSRNAETGELESVHHPFTAPHKDDLNNLKAKNNLTNIRSQAYDLVLNGEEVAGGSIRIHSSELQLFVLDEILKVEHEHLQHMLEALSSGCPPHGGIALGLDRLISSLCNTRSIRDVIAFPKGLEGKDHLTKAPVPITEHEKSLYHIEVKPETNSS